MAKIAEGPEPAPRRTDEEIMASFDSVPLFMKSLPEDDSNEGSASLAALQSLIYEGTPDEIATNFKEQGNEYFKGKRYREALGFYTQGVDTKPEDHAVLEALLCNRAACNLELKNYGSVLRDCSKVLTQNPKSSKAYYRSGLALLALGRNEDALDCCARCLSYDPSNAGVKGLQERALKAKAEAERIEKQKEERLRKEKEAEFALRKAYFDRNIVAFTKKDGSLNPATPHFDEEDPNVMVFPAFFLYPQHATSDIISDFAEDTPFAAHLEAMFPPQAQRPEWDTKGQYDAGNLVVYATTHRKRLLKVGKKMTLRDVLNASKQKEGDPRDGLELRDGCLSFVVLPKGDVEKKWVEDYKKARDA